MSNRQTEPVPDPGNDVAAAPSVPGTSRLYSDPKALRRYILWFTIATAAFTTVWGSTTGILLPNHIQGIEFATWFTGSNSGVDLQQLTKLKAAVDAGTLTPNALQLSQLGILAHFEAARATALATVVAISTIATMIIQPLVGVFSDRTRSRLGRRAPWMIYGSIVGALAMVGLRFSTTIALIAIFWALAQAILNAALTPMLATTADRVAENKRGTASSMAGLGNFVGGIFGAVVAGVAFSSLGLNIYIVWGLLVVLAVVVFVVRNPDQPSRDLDVPAFKWGEFLRGFLVPLKARDFRWVWIARVLLIFGYSVSTALGFYMLQSYITPGLSAPEATQLSPLLGLVGLPFSVIAIVLAGRLSDRIRRRKPFVIAASILMAASMIVPIASHTLPALFVQAIAASIAFGIFLPVDQALFIDVIPNKQSAGRDLGIAVVATLLGQALGPVLAGEAVAITGGYLTVWISALVLSAIAGLAILPVKGAR